MSRKERLRNPDGPWVDEVPSDNSALMRNIRRHEDALEGGITGIARAVMAVSPGFGEVIPDEGAMSVMYDDSIIQDVAAEKAQDMAEVGVTMNVWEYRVKWYGADEKTAKARARELKASGDARVQQPFSKQDNPFRMHRRLHD